MLNPRNPLTQGPSDQHGETQVLPVWLRVCLPPFAQKTWLSEAAPRGNSFSPASPRSFFVKESSARRCRGTRRPAPRRSVQRPGVNGERPARAASARVSGYSDAARGSRCPGSRCPGAPPSPLASAAQRPGRIPTAARPHPGRAAGGRPGAGRAGRAAPDRAPEAGMRGCGLGDQQNSSALSQSAVE